MWEDAILKGGDEMSIVEDLTAELERAFADDCAKREGLLPSRTECAVLRFAANLIVQRMNAAGLGEQAIRNYFCVGEPMRSFRVAKISTFNHMVEVSLPDEEGKERWYSITGEMYTDHNNAELAIHKLAQRLGLGKRFIVQSPGNYVGYAGKTFGFITENALAARWGTPPLELVG
jgi:hypothetical protein